MLAVAARVPMPGIVVNNSLMYGETGDRRTGAFESLDFT